ncbi:MAG TPA: chemotaxis protein CheW, partial [Polyangiales bacterium]|nr:chemotaxis protein CheW [Polyangiales bacterium]
MPANKQRPDLQKSLVGFVVGDVLYAIGIGSVREIVNPVPLTELPHAPPAVCGVMDHRGEVVPVVDLRARFGLPSLSEPRRAKWILVDMGGRLVGLAVDRVKDVFGSSSEEIQAAPSLGQGDEQRGILGVTKHDG